MVRVLLTLTTTSYLFLSSVTGWAEGDPNLDRALATGNFKEARAVLFKSLNSTDRDTVAKAQQVLGERYITIPSETAIEWMQEALNSKLSAAYAPLIFRFVNHESKAANQERFWKIVSQTIATDPALQKILREGAEEKFGRIKPLVSEIKNSSGEKVTQISLPFERVSFADSCRVAKAMFEAKALPNVTHVAYGKSLTPLISEKQLDPATLPDWILDNHKTELFPFLMQMRDELSEQTNPRRTEISEKILKYLTEQSPQRASAMHEAVKTRLLANLPETFPSNRTSVRTRPTLTLSLQDPTDLKLARRLNGMGELGAVEVINWTHTKGEENLTIENKGRLRYDPSSRVIFPAVNYVYANAKDGPTIDSILSEKNFSPSPNTYNAKGALSRNESLLRESYTIRPPYSQDGNKLDPAKACSLSSAF